MSSFVNYRVKTVIVPAIDSNGNDIEKELEVVSMEIMRCESVAENGNIVATDQLFFVCFDKHEFNRVWVIPVETEGEIKIKRYENNEFRRGYKAKKYGSKAAGADSNT
jgi:hypothetical protein